MPLSPSPSLFSISHRAHHIYRRTHFVIYLPSLANFISIREILLTTIELVINSLPNQSTAVTPFFLNYGYEPMTPVQLLRGNKSVSTESVASFVQRVASDWKLARENLRRSVGLQQRIYDRKHKDVVYKVGDLVLLSTKYLRMKGTPRKLQKKFVGPFQVIQTIGQQDMGSLYLRNGKSILCFTCPF